MDEQDCTTEQLKKDNSYLTINDFPNICRSCLSYENLQEFEGLIFDDDTPLIDFCSKITGVQVREDSNLPNKICSICIDQLSQVYLYVRQFKSNDQILRAVDTSNDVLEVCSDECDIYNQEKLLVNDYGRKSTVQSTELVYIDKIVDMVAEDGIKPTDTEINIKSKCGLQFEDATELTTYHKNSHDLLRYSCHICKKRFKMRHRLKVHYIVHSKETPHECNICFKKFKFSHNLTRHKISHSKVLPFECSICKKTFTRRSTRDEHVRGHTEEKGLTCNKCNKSFRTFAGHEFHMNRHKITGPSSRVYNCNVCDKVLSSKWTLRTHMMIHTGERTFLCNICGKSFITKAALNSHSRVHSGDKPFGCLLCPKKFTQRSSLVIHTATHTGIKPFHCDLCSKMFSQRTHLKVHKRLHTGERPYICSYCGKGFSLNGNLKVHTRIHTGETPHKCVICRMGFIDSGSLRKHMSIKHV